MGLGFFYISTRFQIGNKNVRIVTLVVVSFVHQLLKYSLCSAIIKLYYKVEVFLEKLFNFISVFRS